jgi:hypothetical protein
LYNELVELQNDYAKRISGGVDLDSAGDGNVKQPDGDGDGDGYVKNEPST